MQPGGCGTWQRFGSAVGLRTWERHTLAKNGWTLTLTSVPGAHSANRVIRTLLPPVMGSVLEAADRDGKTIRRIYLSRDTMVFGGLDAIARRHGSLDAAVLDTGGTTLPGGFVVTMTGADAVECLRRARPRVAVPVHYDDYGVFKSGLDDVRGGSRGGRAGRRDAVRPAGAIRSAMRAWLWRSRPSKARR